MGEKPLPRELPVKPSVVEWGQLRFLLGNSPADALMPLYVAAYRAEDVSHVVCAAELAYDPAPLAAAGIALHVLAFADGAAPPDALVDQWIALLHTVFGPPGAPPPRPPTVAVHCSAGLGRAPVLVTIALIEYGMEPRDAIVFVRSAHRGAINAQQVLFFKSYRRRTKPAHSSCGLQ